MLNNLSNENNGELNQRIAPVIVEEYRPGVQERIKDKISQVALGFVAVGATSALSFGICAGVTRDPSQCIVPPVITAIIIASVILTANSLASSLRNHLSSIHQVATLESEIVVGIPVSNVPPTNGSTQNRINPINQSNPYASLVFLG